MALYFPSACMLFAGIDEIDGVKVAKVHQHGSVVFVVMADGSVHSFDQYARVPVSNPQQVPESHPQAASAGLLKGGVPVSEEALA
jgi:hypothetical protein